MAREKPVELTISVFKIEPVAESVTDIGLPKKLHSALNSTLSIRDRMMPLNDDINNRDSDFVSNFNFGQGCLFGSFVRLIEGEESAVLLKSLEQKTLNMNEIIKEAKEGTAGSIKGKSFFCMHNDLLVMSAARSNRKSLEDYTNWILRKIADSEEMCKYSPMKNTIRTIPIKDIKGIELADAFIFQNTLTKSETLNLSERVWKILLKDVELEHDLNMDDVLSATLILKINKRLLKKNNAGVLDTALRLVDGENITVIGNDGTRINGTEYLTKFKRTFERTSAGRYNEQAIETEMRKIIKAARNGEVAS
jgi:hypothetical protein